LTALILTPIMLTDASIPRNTTAPQPARVGWVSASGDRSTLQILWSCFSVLLVCTWRCVHPNIPSIEERDAGWRKLAGVVPYLPEGPLLRKWLRRLMGMGITIAAPEYTAAIAVRDYMKAERLVEMMNREGYELSMTQAFYINMGGIFVSARLPTQTENQVNRPQSPQHAGHTPMGPYHGFYLVEDNIG